MTFYALKTSDYSWENALFFGNCQRHYQKAWESAGSDRVIHLVIASIECIPLIGQIAALFEKILVTYLLPSPTSHSLLSERSIGASPIPLRSPLSSGIISPQTPPPSPLAAAQSYGPDLPAVAAASPAAAALQSRKSAILHPSHAIDSKVAAVFQAVDSQKLVPIGPIKSRTDFWQAFRDDSTRREPVILGCSSFVPRSLAEHLMRNKKFIALNVKFDPRSAGSQRPDRITNLEAAFHTFLTPIVPMIMLGDYRYQGGHNIALLPNQQGRKLILSAAVHPDLECYESPVVMPLIKIEQEPVEGAVLEEPFTPLFSRCPRDVTQFISSMPIYDRGLQQHLIYHLTHDHRLPARAQVETLTYSEAIAKIEDLIKDPNPADLTQALRNTGVLLRDNPTNNDGISLAEPTTNLLSLEVLFHLYQHQIHNEFQVLEEMLPQGYVYTMDPPSIFAKQINGNPAEPGVNILNRLQILALKELHARRPLHNLKRIGFNNYLDRGAIDLLQHALPGITCEPKAALFSGPQGEYTGPQGLALVLHNNSDGFGENILNEGSKGSMDAIIGEYSDASIALSSDNPNLLDHIVYNPLTR